MEIERKFLIRDLPKDLKQYPFHRIEQGYLSVNPGFHLDKDTTPFPR